MDAQIVVALVAFLGTAVGTFGGLATSAKLTAYRLKQLEKRVNELGALSVRLPVVEEQVKTLHARMQEFRKGVGI